MGECIVTRRGGGAEGIHIPEDEFNCWLYGNYQPNFTGDGVLKTLGSQTNFGRYFPIVSYGNISFQNGIAVLSGKNESNNAYGALHRWVFGGHGLCYIDTFNDMNGGAWLNYTQYYSLTSPHWINKIGEAYSKDANKYPAAPSGGAYTDGYYYERRPKIENG